MFVMPYQLVGACGLYLLPVGACGLPAVCSDKSFVSSTVVQMQCTYMFYRIRCCVMQDDIDSMCLE